MRPASPSGSRHSTSRWRPCGFVPQIAPRLPLTRRPRGKQPFVPRWETWREVFRLSDPMSTNPGDAYLEKSADKWARNVEGWEWNEKW